ncbi:hypothetical protein [Pseudomaricurvus sp. HS19]|uniref:hypothetical protein n=1 Tax=Pseudomaricurvus sp. HS19 TaxID=2692626 RepID=UPI00136C91E6|nr:hypothetical protein [Pseudomaricurvus sp. HS19]MYM62635.1 hypothetical protein [Pseudomaricurvus sp. HS19]
MKKVALLVVATLMACGCAEFKDAGRSIGHGTRDAMTSIGHGTKRVVNETAASIEDSTSK